MIEHYHIDIWESLAPWQQKRQIEHDLILSRALVELFSSPLLAEEFAFRGGTALHKLYFKPASRYSEDIDLVQIRPGPSGPAMSAIREKLTPWLGKPRWSHGPGRIKFYYRYISQDDPPERMKLKIEINTDEHMVLMGTKKLPFAVESEWYSGEAEITVFELEEILGSKLTALYGRNKGRDLFDMEKALADGRAEPKRILEMFREYRALNGEPVTRALFEKNLADKIGNERFKADITRLLPAGATWDIEKAAQTVSDQLIALLPGDPWVGEGDS